MAGPGIALRVAMDLARRLWCHAQHMRLTPSSMIQRCTANPICDACNAASVIHAGNDRLRRRVTRQIVAIPLAAVWQMQPCACPHPAQLAALQVSSQLVGHVL